jgi:competence protein ComEA
VERKNFIHRVVYLLTLLSLGAGVVALLTPRTTVAAQVTTPAEQHSEFPAGTGRDVVLEICGKCHSPNIILAYGQNRLNWENTVTKMVQKGAEGTDEDFTEIADYLTEKFPPSTLQKIFVNMASDKQLATVLDISLDDAKAIVTYRDNQKGFNSIDDMKKVPNVDTKKIDAKKDQLVFGAGVKP